MHRWLGECPLHFGVAQGFDFDEGRREARFFEDLKVVIVLGAPVEVTPDPHEVRSYPGGKITVFSVASMSYALGDPHLESSDFGVVAVARMNREKQVRVGREGQAATRREIVLVLYGQANVVLASHDHAHSPGLQNLSKGEADTKVDILLEYP
jgi:hypothetical protein